MRSPALRPGGGSPLSEPGSVEARECKEGERADLRRPPGVGLTALVIALVEMGFEVGREEMFSVRSVIVLSLRLRSM